MNFQVSSDGCPLIILVAARGDQDDLGVQIQALAEFGRTCSCRILAEGDVAHLNRVHRTALHSAGMPAIEALPGSVGELHETVLSGRAEGGDQIALVGDLAHLSTSLLRETPVVIVGCGMPSAPSSVELGCTLVTSVFRSDEYLRGFINNSEALTGYDRMIDHIFLVSKLSPLELELFLALMARRRNVILVWNRKDPGLYNCWNLGIRMARRTYVSNANVDDLREPDHVVALIRDLEIRPECVVAASAMRPFYEFPEDGTLPDIDECWYSEDAGYFDIDTLARFRHDPPPYLESHNLPHCMPVWRREVHDRYGWFDEERYGPYADWAFWMRIVRDGRKGWLNPEPLGYYFINLDSHNRRGADLSHYHDAVENEVLGSFQALLDGRSPHACRRTPSVEPKLILSGKTVGFGEHRHSFNAMIHALEPLERKDGEGVLFVPFLERQFVWGDAPGEAASNDPQPIARPWIGILHVPFEAPSWFMPEVSPESFFETDLWKRSRPYCRGVITLAHDLEADLKAFDPDLPTLTVWHPTAFDAAEFDPSAYRARPRVVQVGDWLRKLQAIHRLRAPGHERIMLTKQHTQMCLEREIAQFGDDRDPSVDMRHLVPNEEYDELLSSSVVICLLYGTAANNAVIECIARATPILINPLPAVVEYLGLDYPLYARDEAEADTMLASPGKIEAAHEYLRYRRNEIDLSYDGFCRDIAASEFYSRLVAKEGIVA